VLPAARGGALIASLLFPVSSHEFPAHAAREFAFKALKFLGVQYRRRVKNSILGANTLQNPLYQGIDHREQFDIDWPHSQLTVPTIRRCMVKSSAATSPFECYWLPNEASVSDAPQCSSPVVRQRSQGSLSLQLAAAGCPRRRRFAEGQFNRYGVRAEPSYYLLSALGR